MGNQITSQNDVEKRIYDGDVNYTRTTVVIDEIPKENGKINLENLFPEWNNRIAKEFTFNKQLGKGGFGTVWRAVRNSDRKAFACKIIEKAKMKLSNLQSLRDEVAFMQQLHHPGIVKIHQGYETRKKLYLVMDLCTGGEIFDQLMKCGRMNEEQVTEYTAQLLSVLKYCHAKGVIHCDLKPENLVLSTKEQRTQKLKVIDFGLTKCRRHHEYLKKVGGTPAYIAPECLKRRFTEECDMWAVGVIVFELIHGYLPFKSVRGNPIATIKNSAKGFENVVKSGRGSWFNTSIPISNEAMDFIANCLQVSPAHRLTADEALHHRWITRDLNTVLDPMNCMVLRELAQKTRLTELERFMQEVVINTQETDEWFMKEIKDLFDTYDTDKDGLMDMPTFSDAVKKLTKKVNFVIEKDFMRIFDEMDTDHDGKISYQEFMRRCCWSHIKTTDDRLYDAVLKLDPDHKGNISLEFLKQMMKNSDYEVSEPTMKSIEDLATNGEIDYLDFLHLVDSCTTESMESIDIPTDSDLEIQSARSMTKRRSAKIVLKQLEST